jgi:hypothetical protein
VRFEGSNNGTTWTYLKELPSSMAQMTEITLLASNVGYYKYYRIYALHTAAPTDGVSLSVYEWQTTEYAIAQTDKARKVKKAYAGIEGKARKIKKGYIGVNGIAQLFYSPERLIPFTSNPVPTTWVDDGSEYISATATNDYGAWEVSASDSYSSSSAPSDAFDDSASTYYAPESIGSASTVRYLYLDLPKGVSIQLDQVYLKYNYCGSSSYPCYLQGYDGANWHNLTTLGSSTSSEATTFTLSVKPYCTRFRIALYRYSSTYTSPRIYKFEMRAGTLKIEE